MPYPSSTITYQALTVALDRCMKAHPPAGAELTLHSDANQMAELWAPMCLEGTSSVEVSSVRSTIAAAFFRWSLSK